MMAKDVVPLVGVGLGLACASAAALMLAPEIAIGGLAVAAVSAGYGAYQTSRGEAGTNGSDRATSPPPTCDSDGCESHDLIVAPGFKYYPDLKPSEACICKTCFERLYGEARRKYQRAVDDNKSVEVVSANYQGQIHRRMNVKEKSIVTPYFTDKDEAWKSLRVMAYYHGFDGVYQAEESRKKEQEGNYKYWIFSCSGRAYLRA